MKEKNMKATIAIDLAIRQSGIVIAVPKTKNIAFNWVRLPKWENNERYFNLISKKWEEQLNVLLDQAKKNNINEFSLIVELANFNNALHTQRMSLIMGMVIQLIYSKLGPIETKITNANGWFQHFNKEFSQINNWTSITREERKRISINYFLKQFEKFNISTIFFNGVDLNDVSDIADAYWMSYYYEKIK